MLFIPFALKKNVSLTGLKNGLSNSSNGPYGVHFAGRLDYDSGLKSRTCGVKSSGCDVGDSVLGYVQDTIAGKYVDGVLCQLSDLLEAFPEGIADAENNSIYTRLLHRRSCVLGIFGNIFETTVLADFLHIFKNAAKAREIIYRIYLDKFLSYTFYR